MVAVLLLPMVLLAQLVQAAGVVAALVLVSLAAQVAVLVDQALLLLRMRLRRNGLLAVLLQLIHLVALPIGCIPLQLAER
jgi:hypothetical protein